jgi:ribosomal protein S7
LIGKRSFTTKQHSHEVIETSSMNWQQSPQSTNKVSDSKLKSSAFRNPEGILKNSPSGDRGVTPPNFDLEGIQFASSNPMSNKKGIEVSLRERFIQRLILDGKKATASKIFDESLELLKKRIEQYNSSNDGRGKSDDLHSLSTLTKDEIFVIALRKAQPWVTTSSLRRGGKKVIIPEILTPSQQESMAIR